jgi:hypothetical protein
MFVEVDTFVGLTTAGRWIDHKLNCHLTDCVGAQFETLQLVEDGLRLRTHVVQLVVAATEAALAKHALGNRVDRNHLNLVAVLPAHLVQDLAQGDELTLLGVHVLLVDLVGHDEDVVLVAELDNLFEVAAAHDLTRGVSWVDHDNGAGNEPRLSTVVDLLLEGLSVQGPALIFLQVVGQESSVSEGKKRGVKGVLRNRHQDTIMGVSNQGLERSLHAFGSAISQVNIFGIRGDTISFTDEFRDGLAHVSPALRVLSVGTDRRVASLFEFIHAALGILADAVSLEERLVHKACNNLAVESNTALADLLGVANVKGCGFREAVVVDTSFDFRLNFEASLGNLSANSVHGLSDIAGETVENGLVLASHAPVGVLN